MYIYKYIYIYLMVQPCSTHLFKRGHQKNCPAPGSCASEKKQPWPVVQRHAQSFAVRSLKTMSSVFFFSDHGMFQPSYMGMILR